MSAFEIGGPVVTCGITRAGECFPQDMVGPLGVLGALASVDSLCIHTFFAEQVFRGSLS
jgi:hypothetical protein